MLRFPTIKGMFQGFTLGLAAALLATPASAVDVSQVPLLVSNSVAPNVMFVLDDSGSMHYEVMPDEDFRFGSFTVSTRWVYPRVTDVYGSDDYDSNVATVDDHVFNARARSPQINKLYYNPSITYRPWVKWDNSLYDDAEPSMAYHNPEKTGRGYRNLTIDNTNTNTGDGSVSSELDRWRACTGPSSGQCSSDTSNKTFWPATYFWYTGTDSDADKWDPDNYERVEIRPATATYPGHGRSERSDCAADACTYAEEIQNFANWYTYYRSRILASRAAVGRAFANQAESMRVGYGAINKGSSSIDGTSTSTIVKGVRPFSGTDRQDFFTQLYTRDIPTSGTPLRRALNDAGQYYSRSDNSGPWGNTPGTNDSTAHLECRQSYTILMSDGYWSGSSPSVGDQDGSGDTSWTGPDGQSGGYTVGPPFEDSHTDTLADVAMRYWKQDLRTNLVNDVPTSDNNPAFWQHMVTFTVGLGVEGSIDPDDAFAAITDGTSIAWPNPTDGNPQKIDDMLHAAVNSRGGFFSAADPDTFADELALVLRNVSDRVGSAASVAANSTRLETGSRIYQARFDSEHWTGDLLSFALASDGSVISPAEWNAANLIAAPGSRNITSYRPDTGGIDFDWDALSSDQQVLLNTDGLGEDRVAYLRGDTSQEVLNGGVFRDRNSKLGDIVNSAPAFMGTQDYGFYNLPDPEDPEASSYRTFLASKADRPATIFVGANDGMLHAFNAETGVELFAFIPNAVYENLASLSDPSYSHRFFVDGSPRLLDAYLSGQWRTILVGSTGAGGRSVFALDVTDPVNFGPEDVLWEFTHAELGVTVGQPSIARLTRNDQWVAIFGNGYNSASNKAQLFIVDLETGALEKLIDTGIGTAGDPNGLSSPVPVDISGDRVTTMVYAGDLHGNMWNFDLSHSSNKGQWGLEYSAGLFTAIGPNDERQPITVRPTVARHPDGGQMLFFGTGKYFETGDNIIPDDPPVQSFYGILDNGSSITGRDQLQEQQILVEEQAGGDIVFDYRVMSDNTVNYPTQKGWYLDLESPLAGPEGERVIGNALLRSGRIIFVTVTPSTDPCGYGGSSWLMELDALSGSRLAYAVFDLDGSGDIDSSDAVNIGGDDTGHGGGMRINDFVSTPYVLETGGETEFKYMSGASGDVTVVEESSGNVNLGRQSWRQLR